MEHDRVTIALDRDKALLYLAILLLLAGSVGLLWWNSSNGQKLEEQARTLNNLVADNLALDHEGAIYGIRQFLITSEYLAELSERDPEHCSALLRRISTAYPYFLNIGITDEKGTLLCSGIQTDRIASIGNDDDFKTLLESKKFTVSGYRINSLTGRPSVRFLQPIIVDGRLDGAIYVSFGVEWLNGFSSDTSIPEGTVITKFDQNGTVFMRYPNPLAWSGTNQAETELFGKIQAVKSGFTTARGLDGKERLYYVRPIYHDGDIHAYAAVGKL